MWTMKVTEGWDRLIPKPHGRHSYWQSNNKSIGKLLLEYTFTSYHWKHFTYSWDRLRIKTFLLLYFKLVWNSSATASVSPTIGGSPALQRALLPLKVTKYFICFCSFSWAKPENIRLKQICDAVFPSLFSRCKWCHVAPGDFMWSEHCAVLFLKKN